VTQPLNRTLRACGLDLAPQSQPFRFVGRSRRGQGEAGAPGEQVCGECGHRQADPGSGRLEVAADRTGRGGYSIPASNGGFGTAA